LEKVNRLELRDAVGKTKCALTDANVCTKTNAGKFIEQI